MAEGLTAPARDVTIPRAQKGMRRVQREKKVDYDAIVVGSGASGGWVGAGIKRRHSTAAAMKSFIFSPPSNDQGAGRT